MQQDKILTFNVAFNIFNDKTKLVILHKITYICKRKNKLCKLYSLKSIVSFLLLLVLTS